VSLQIAVEGAKDGLAKHVMTDQEYRVYKKTHQYAHALDEEEGKIARERGNYVKLRKVADRKLKVVLHDLVQIVEDDDPEEGLGIEEELAAERELRNAAVHKRRLRDLARREG